MGKRLNNFYYKIYDIDNIKLAHQKAKKDKSHYTAVQKTDENLETRCLEIQQMLKNHTYKVGRYKTSIIQDKNKTRILYKLGYYPDRIIQWAFMLQLEERFTKVFTADTGASMKGRGIHYLSKRLYRDINIYPEETKYCLKLDIKKFYPNIDQTILKSLLRKIIKDKDVLIELDKIIDSMNSSDINKLNLPQDLKEIYTQKGKGVPIGSYLSQYLANFYLTYFDHWIKEELKCKFYYRYMDDIVILSDSKEFLHFVLEKIKQYLKEKLKLEIKSNYQIYPIDIRGIDFVGYRHFRGYKLLRKSTIKKCKQNLITINKQTIHTFTDKQWSSWLSEIGWLTWSDSTKFYNKYATTHSKILVNSYYLLNKISAKKKLNTILVDYTNKIKLNKIYYNHINYKFHNKIHKE